MSKPTTPLVKRWLMTNGQLEHVGMAPRPRPRHAAEIDDADLDDLEVALDSADADQPEWQS